MSLATLTNSGRAAIAQAILSLPLHYAWGSGEPGWDDDPDKQHLDVPLVDAVALNNELGRRAVTAAAYVLPDSEGEIVIPEGRDSQGGVVEARFSISPTPTRFIYLRANFDYDNASNQIIREVAVFSNTTIKEGLPPGQRYFTPADVEDPGHLLCIQRLDPVILRSPAIRHSFEFVLEI